MERRLLVKHRSKTNWQYLRKTLKKMQIMFRYMIAVLHIFFFLKIFSSNTDVDAEEAVRT